MKTRNVFKTEPVKEAVCKTFNVWKNNKNHKIEVLGNNAKTPFKKGNQVLVNGKEIAIGKYEIDGKEVTIQKGVIASVTSLNAKTPGTRNVIKPSGKKVIAVKKLK